MEIAMCVAVVSALAMGAVYLIDMAMVGDTYSKPSQAMLISSVASFLPAPILFLLDWNIPPPEAIVVALVGGFVLMLANWLYFIVLFSDEGECTEIACYENSSILVIVLVTATLSALGYYHETIFMVQYVGVGLGVIGLLGLALLGVEKIERVCFRHRKMLIGFMILGAGYELLVDYALHLALFSPTIKTPLQAYVSISPFFWFGLFTGVVAIWPKAERDALRENWNVIRSKWKWIVAAETCGLVAFGSMVYSFSVAHVAVVAMIAGSFPIIVFIGGIVLRRSYGFSEEKFPVVDYPAWKTLAIVLTITGAIIAGS